MNGDSVICTNGKFSDQQLAWFAENKIKFPLEGKIYTIRGVVTHSSFENRNMTGLRLNEINNPKVKIFLELEIEPTFSISRFSTLLGLPLKKEEIEIKQTNYTEI